MGICQRQDWNSREPFGRGFFGRLQNWLGGVNAKRLVAESAWLTEVVVGFAYGSRHLGVDTGLTKNNNNVNT